jgi:hypothetical protein
MANLTSVPDEVLRSDIFKFLSQYQLNRMRCLSRDISSIVSKAIEDQCPKMKEFFDNLHNEKYIPVYTASTIDEALIMSLAEDNYLSTSEKDELLQYYINCLNCEQLQTEISDLLVKFIQNKENSLGLNSTPNSPTSVFFGDVVNSRKHEHRVNFLLNYYSQLISIVYMAFILKCTSTNNYAEFPSISDVDVFPELYFNELMVLKSNPSNKNEMIEIIENYVQFVLLSK